MAVLALDLGTTKICALVMDEESGAILETRYADSAFLPAANYWDRRQDPEQILVIVRELVLQLVKKYQIFRCIGLTNQMHGILYIDCAGRALSPLYTWQDLSASLAMENGESYAGYLAKLSPGPIAPGYGLATCFYHLFSGQIPEGAAKICTIGDYIAMKLCNSTQPVMHITNAGGWGFFDLRRFKFDEKSMELAGLDPSLLPRTISDGEVLGEFSEGIPVCVSIGDNQASFLGSVQDSQGSIAVNIGTGSQISMVSSCPENPGSLEVRPFFEGRYLLVGASLCGGRSYAILEGFFRQVLTMAGSSGEASLYEAMNALAAEAKEPALTVNTLFAGSRTDPSVRGSILNISEDNFTPANLVTGFLNGVVQELYNLYLPHTEKGDTVHERLIGAGNGIRKGRPLKRILSEKFGMPLEIPLYQEEAAYGAAIFALTCTGYFENIFQAQRLVRYEDKNI
jgi:sedoheptulokinase